MCTTLNEHIIKVFVEQNYNKFYSRRGSASRSSPNVLYIISYPSSSSIPKLLAPARLLPYISMSLWITSSSHSCHPGELRPCTTPCLPCRALSFSFIFFQKPVSAPRWFFAFANGAATSRYTHQRKLVSDHDLLYTASILPQVQVAQLWTSSMCHSAAYPCASR